MSFIGNIPSAHDFFMHKAGIDTHWPLPEGRGWQPYIALADKSGYTVVHGHPLNGTKVFTWGASAWGKFQQDFMGAADYNGSQADHAGGAYNPDDGHARIGDYCEAQIGPAASQEHVFPVVANSSYQWTEFYAGWTPHGGTATMQSKTTPRP